MLGGEPTEKMINALVDFNPLIKHSREAVSYTHLFIFLEYFIIHDGRMWREILQVLEEKVKEGVDVRLIYDDMGCVTTLPHSCLLYTSRCV